MSFSNFSSLTVLPVLLVDNDGDSDALGDRDDGAADEARNATTQGVESKEQESYVSQTMARGDSEPLVSATQRLLSGYAQKLLQRTPAKVLPPPPMDAPMNDFILQGFASKWKERASPIASAECRATTINFNPSSGDGDLDDFDEGEIDDDDDNDSSLSSSSDDDKDPEVVAKITSETKKKKRRKQKLAKKLAKQLAKRQGKEQERKPNDSGTFNLHFDESRYYVSRTNALKVGAEHIGASNRRTGGAATSYPRRWGARNPCFLCAKEGHQASQCPSAVCYRCERSFAVHDAFRRQVALLGSRDEKPLQAIRAQSCPPKDWGRLFFCARCGTSEDHDTPRCPFLGSSSPKSKGRSEEGESWMPLLTQGAECLTCRKVHQSPKLFCQPVLSPKTKCTAEAEVTGDESEGDDNESIDDEEDDANEEDGHVNKRKRVLKSGRDEGACADEHLSTPVGSYYEKDNTTSKRKGAGGMLIAGGSLLIFCASCGKSGHQIGMCSSSPRKSQQRSPGLSLMAPDRKRARLGPSPRIATSEKCWSCGEEGHRSRDCPNKTSLVRAGGPGRGTYRGDRGRGQSGRGQSGRGQSGRGRGGLGTKKSGNSSNNGGVRYGGLSYGGLKGNGNVHGASKQQQSKKRKK